MLLAMAARTDYKRDELLIELVRSFPCLYELKDKSYKSSKAVKENAWGNIVEEMHKNGFVMDGK